MSGILKVLLDAARPGFDDVRSTFQGVMKGDTAPVQMLAAGYNNLINTISLTSPLNTLMNLFSSRLKSMDMPPITVDGNGTKPTNAHVTDIQMDRGINRLSRRDNDFKLTLSDGSSVDLDAEFIKKGEHGKRYLEAKYDVDGDGDLDTIISKRGKDTDIIYNIE